jgi:hypothetical protein
LNIPFRRVLILDSVQFTKKHIAQKKRGVN